MEIRERLEEIWQDCREFLPTEDVVSVFKELSGSFTELDLSGLEAVTDEIFHALLELKAGGSVTKVTCVGCVHITDFGISLLSQACPKLSEVLLDGCFQLTSQSLHHLSTLCPDLKLVSVCGTSVSHLPPSVPASVQVKLEGCPLLHQPGEETSQEEDDDLSAKYKLVILGNRDLGFSFTDFLTAGKLTESEDNWNTAKYRENVELRNVSQFKLNIFECHTERIMYAPFLSDRTAFIFPLEFEKGENPFPYLDIMTILSEIHGQVLHSPMHVVCLHDGEGEVTARIEKLSEDIRTCHTRQRDMFDGHLRRESYIQHEEVAEGDRDFLTQVRYSRALNHRETMNTLKIYALNTKNQELELIYPKVTTDATTRDEDLEKTEGDTQSQSKAEDQEQNSPVKRTLSMAPDASIIDTGFSIDDLYKKRELLLNKADELLNETVSKSEEANHRIDGLSKSEITEVKSFATPPGPVKITIGTVAVMFGMKSDWASCKMLLSKPGFIFELRQFDKDTVTRKQMKMLEEYVGDPGNDPDVLMRFSKLTGVLGLWLHNLYTYNKDIAGPLNVIRAKLKMMDETIARLIKKKGLLGKGPALLQAFLNKDIQNLHEKMFPHLTIHRTSIFTELDSTLEELKSEKLVTFKEFWDKFSPKSKHNALAVQKALEHLHKVGSILFFKDVPGQPVVTDIPHFMAVLSILHQLTEDTELHNGNRVPYLGATIPIFTQSDISKQLMNLPSKKVGFMFDIFEDLGIVIQIPKKQMTLGKSGEHHYFSYSSLSEKTEGIYLRDSAASGKHSTAQFTETFWGADKANFFWLEHSYSFPFGMPISLMPQVLAECIQLGVPIHVYKWGISLRHAAVEILFRINVNLALQIKGIDITLRTNKGGVHHVKLDHVWGIFSHYLLIMDHLSHRYQHLGVKVRQPCRGAWCEEQDPHLFPICGVPRRTGSALQCPKCIEKSMTVDQTDLLTGRQRFLAFHNFVDSTDPKDEFVNPGLPYILSDKTDTGTSNTKWRCFVCAMSLETARRLWVKESALYPAFVSSSFTKPETDPDDPPSLSEKGNMLTTNDNLKSDSMATVITKEPLIMTGFLGLSLTRMTPGKVAVALGGVRHDVRYDTIEDLKDISHIFHLDSGLLKSRLEGDLKEENFEPVGLFETFSIEVSQELEEDTEETRIVFKRNGIKFTSLPETRSRIAILFEADPDGNKPAVMIHCPTMPVVRTHHFPLGSAMFHKLGVSQQWTLGQVLATKKGKLIIGDKLEEAEGKEESYETFSEDILPLTCHMNTATVVIDKEIARNNKQYLDWMMERGSWPTPTSLFTGFYQNMQNYNLLRVEEFEFDSWRCMSSRHSPQVLNVRVYKNLHVSSRRSSGWQERTYVLLPSFASPRLLYNPHVSVAHNMDNQALHTICTGGKLNGIGKYAYTSDAHFIGVPPRQLTREEAEAVAQQFTKGLLHTYLSMSIMDEVFMPYEDLPGTDLFEVGRCLKNYIDIYLATFALQNWFRKFEPKTKADPEQENLIKELTKDQDDPLAVGDTNETVRIVTKKGRVRKKVKTASRICESHQRIAKLAGQKAEITAEDKEQIFAKFVRSLAMKNSPLESAIVEKELKTFTNLLVLNVQGSKLESLPGLKACPNLTDIDLSRNRFTEVPAEIAGLVRTLKCLDVSDNPITRFPDFITNMSSLLKLTATFIKELPEDFGRLTALHTLSIRQLMVTKLPESFSKLKHLEDLQLDGVPMIQLKGRTLIRTNWMALYTKNQAKITYGVSQQWWEEFYDRFDVKSEKVLSEEVSSQFLQELSNHFPRFGHDAVDPSEGFPKQILQCHRLRFLILRNHAFQQVPDTISQLRSLVSLNVMNNLHLETLGSETGKLVKLKELAVANCPNLRTPPPEIVSQGNNTLIAYLRRLSQGSVSCHRTKLMFVGLGGAGKTSLMRALMSADGRCPVTEGEGITDGIDISAWTMPYNGQTYTFSVWDFAGQTVYYNTHQFFLSKRAVYMLIWNTRLGYEHSGLEFWLSSIACHTPKAPIFVIGTHADQISKADLPEDKLRRTFPNIVGFIFVSSTTGKGVENLRSQFLEVASNQPYIGERIPEAWLSFERLILSERSNERKLLNWNEVVNLAEKAAITGQEIRRAVLFLHELGTLQYFDNELLRDRVVINPQWIVDVMACVISVHDTPIKDGRLSHSDLGLVWEKKYPKKLHQWLLRLTEVFDLTFPLPNTEENIVPCLLPQNEPKYDWPVISDDIIEMRMFYRFDYLPAGLFNRAQVRLYQFSDSSAMWKEGSVLKKNENTGLVKQTKDDEVMVKVAGRSPENILLLVHEVIEGLIAEFFQGVKYEYHLPCMDCIRMDAKDPAMFSSRVMNRAVQMKALFLQCHAFFHTLSITEIQAVMPPASNTDYALQLESAIEKLGELQEDLASEVFFIYCSKDVPEKVLDDSNLHPRRLKTDLEAAGIKCCYEDNLQDKPVGEIMMSMRNSKICLIFISNEFVEDVACQRLFYFMLNNVKTDFILVMVGGGREWQTSDIGGKLTEHVYINFQRMPQYSEKLQELLLKLNQKLNKEEESAIKPPEVFLSYCWSNSERSVKQRIARMKEGALGAGDPRDIKDYLESNGFNVWLDLEQTGKAGLFEDIAAGMRKAKVVVACVSDEYVLSQNCQMEFRFAHIALHKPIILVVVGTGFLWEATEIGMLSLGYPKVYFQVSNNLAHKMLLEYVQERVEAATSEEQVERPVSAVSNSQKEMAFQELYELAQRKFLRQIASYMEPTDPYPRLFVVDLSFDPEASTKQTDAGLDDLDLEICEKPDKRVVMEDLETGMFSIKTLCEHEGGWHAVMDGVPLDIGGSSLKSLWKMVSPYMARILAILKHSPVNLHIIQHPEGNRLHQILEKKASIQPLVDLKPIYSAIRKFVMRKDTEKKRGGLSRCHLPSGKVLWLCPTHQEEPRITVLTEDDDEEEEETDLDVNPEEELLAALSKFSATEDMDQEEELPTTKPLSGRPTSVKKQDQIMQSKPSKEDKMSPEAQGNASKPRTPVVKKEVKKFEPKKPVLGKSSRSGLISRQMTVEEKANIAATVAAGTKDNTSQACTII